MKRTIYNSLLNWKEDSSRMPLVIRGARQVGKTYILKEFGENEYNKKGKAFHFIDLSKQKNLHSIFKEEGSAKKIVSLLELALNITINLEEDLLVIDEIQECAQAMVTFKAFQEELPMFDLIGSGSHLGLIKNEESFPVGKVNCLFMGPMTFEEYLMEKNKSLFNFYNESQIEDSTKINSVIHDSFLSELRTYFAIGGLPNVIATYLATLKIHTELESLKAARKVQTELITGYKSDFSKYAGVENASHILSVFEAIGSQLAKVQDESVKRFHFKKVIPGNNRFDKIRGPLGWLSLSRLCIINKLAKIPEHPLSAYTNDNKFKLFLFDIGILQSLLEIPIESIVSDELGSYKGYIAENFVAQEIFAKTNNSIYGWSPEKGEAEVEFILIKGKELVPVEVKSSSKSRRSKSLDAYVDKFKPKLAFKISSKNRGYDKSKNIYAVPIYLAGKITT